MANLTDKQKIDALYQAIVGMPDNQYDTGMTGAVAEIKEHLKKLNGQVTKNTTYRVVTTKIFIGIGSASLTGLIAWLVIIATPFKG